MGDLDAVVVSGKSERAAVLFIDRTVAVVVFLVATNLLDRLDLSNASAGVASVDALLFAFLAGSHTGCGCRGSRVAIALRAFIDGAVAVVVFAVAGLCAGLPWSGVASYVVLRGVADPLALGNALSFAEGAVFAEVFLNERFIDVAVAVVVFAIADLGAGGASLRITNYGIARLVADFFACGFAFPFAYFAGVAEALEGLVDVAVAVVVFAVASLSFGLDLSLASSPFAAVVAGLGSFFAFSHVRTTGLCRFGSALATVVRSSVAVVILTVTGFFGDRLDFAFARAPFALATSLHAR